jgi:APA family basic amino acid/polyamine antiporter
LAYAELASSIGGCGSAYAYSYSAFGEIVAWIIGWDLILEYGISVAAVANGWSGYFANGLSAIGLTLPEMLTKAPMAGGLINLPAFSIVLILMVLLIIGVKESARLNAVMVAVKLATILTFIVTAVFYLNSDNWSPFMPYGWFSYNSDGKPVGVLAGASIVFFAYVGFDAVSTAAEEAHNPKRDVPIGIITSLLFCTVIYIVVSFLLTGIVPYTELGNSSPVAYALQKVGANWASALVATGVIAGLTTVMLVLYYALTRVIFAMCRDGLLPNHVAVVNPKTQTPIPVIVGCGVIIAITAGLVPLGELAELVNIGTLFAFALVCGGVMYMRHTHPDLPRPFTVPFSPYIPILGVLSCSGLMLFLPAVTWLRFFTWLAIGMFIYFFYSLKHSQLAKEYP